MAACGEFHMAAVSQAQHREGQVPKGGLLGRPVLLHPPERLVQLWSWSQSSHPRDDPTPSGSFRIRAASGVAFVDGLLRLPTETLATSPHLWRGRGSG